jgi:hypothetical protein
MQPKHAITPRRFRHLCCPLVALLATVVLVRAPLALATEATLTVEARPSNPTGHTITSSPSSTIYSPTSLTTPSSSVPLAEEQSASVLCTEAVALTNIQIRGRHILIRGIVRAKYVGQSVKIMSQAKPRGRKGSRKSSRRLIGFATVKANGTFQVTVKRPPGGAAYSTRYVASVGSKSSVALKIPGWLHLTRERSLGASRVQISGRMTSSAHNRRPLSFTRETGCSSARVVSVGTLRTQRNGSFTLILNRPSAANTFTTYRIQTVTGGKTFGLPIVIAGG